MSTLAGVLLLVTIVGGLIALAFSPKVKKWMQKMISPYEEGETFDGEQARDRAPRGTVLYSREELRVVQLPDHVLPDPPGWEKRRRIRLHKRTHGFACRVREEW